MDRKIQDVMTRDVETVGRAATLREIARAMKLREIGDVIVVDEQGKLFGIVTDRDVVVRGIAEGANPDEVTASEVCSSEEVIQLAPDATIDDAIRLMAEHAIRRVPVVQDGKLVGIVSIGDLAKLGESRYALAEISDSPPNA
jgi:CBS domain-containing protein